MTGLRVPGLRLVISDVDGTLVDKRKDLADATVAAVARLQDAGVDFTIVSARPISGMLPIADALAIDGPMGAFNGGTIFRRDRRIERADRGEADPAMPSMRRVERSAEQSGGDHVPGSRQFWRS